MGIIRKDFESFIKKHGHDLIIGHSDNNLKCKCTHESGKVDPKCHLCFGTGRHFVWKKARSRRVNPKNLVSTEQGGKSNRDISKLWSSLDINYFFRPNIKLKEKDFILEYQKDYLIGDDMVPDLYTVKNEIKRQDVDNTVAYLKTPVSKYQTSKGQIKNFISDLRLEG